ncbi:MAG: DinB family protein [Anaerolineales bacterium]|nr:DinB family protein [Anaerolineales bacterium]WKZ40321.1 MAG: DinB family protein [Anaerolineales bacterium]
MKELLEYRVKLVERLGEATIEFCAACTGYNDPFAITVGDWTVHQIAAHTRDVEKSVYGARVRRVLEQENPEFASFDADAWMAKHYRKDEPLTQILDELSASVNGLCEMLKDVPREAWSRVSRHETMGGELTMQLWVERSLAHIEEHLTELKKAGNP